MLTKLNCILLRQKFNIIHKLRSNLLVIYLDHNRNIADNTKSAQNILKDVLVIEDIINYDNIDIQVKFENQKFSIFIFGT